MFSNIAACNDRDCPCPIKRTDKQTYTQRTDNCHLFARHEAKTRHFVWKNDVSFPRCVVSRGTFATLGVGIVTRPKRGMEHVQGNESRVQRGSQHTHTHVYKWENDRYAQTHGHVTAEKGMVQQQQQQQTHRHTVCNYRVPSLVSTRRPRALLFVPSRPRSSQKPWKTKEARAKKPCGSIKGTSRVLVNASSPLKEVRIRNNESHKHDNVQHHDEYHTTTTPRRTLPRRRQ